jgi:hypothetical protein
MPDSKHPAYCRKEREIAEIHTKVKRIEKVVMDGNGNEPLATCVPTLSKNVKTLTEKTIPDLQTGLRSFVQFQENMNGLKEGKRQIRRRDQWLIGLLVGANVTLLIGIISLILKQP